MVSTLLSFTFIALCLSTCHVEGGFIHALAPAAPPVSAGYLDVRHAPPLNGIFKSVVVYHPTGAPASEISREDLKIMGHIPQDLLDKSNIGKHVLNLRQLERLPEVSIDTINQALQWDKETRLHADAKITDRMIQWIRENRQLFRVDEERLSLYFWAMKHVVRAPETIWWDHDFINAKGGLQLIEIGDLLQFSKTSHNLKMTTDEMKSAVDQIIRLLYWDGLGKIRTQALSLEKLFQFRDSKNLSMYKERVEKLMPLLSEDFQSKTLDQRKLAVMYLYLLTGNRPADASTKAEKAVTSFRFKEFSDLLISGEIISYKHIVSHLHKLLE